MDKMELFFFGLLLALIIIFFIFILYFNINLNKDSGLKLKFSNQSEFSLNNASLTVPLDVVDYVDSSYFTTVGSSFKVLKEGSYVITLSLNLGDAGSSYPYDAYIDFYIMQNNIAITYRSTIYAVEKFYPFDLQTLDVYWKMTDDPLSINATFQSAQSLTIPPGGAILSIY